MSQTILAFDFGMRNIGVAVGQTLTRTAEELAPLKAKDGIPNWNHIHDLIEEWKPDVLIVGQPKNMDGSEGEMEPAARKFANRLRERYQLPVEFMDERLSSFAAKQEALGRGQRPNYEKKPIDSIAARLILESWMNESEKGEM